MRTEEGGSGGGQEGRSDRGKEEEENGEDKRLKGESK